MKKLLLAGIAASMVYTIAARAADDDPPPTTIAFPALATGLAVQRHPRHRHATPSASSTTLVVRFGAVATSP